MEDSKPNRWLLLSAIALGVASVFFSLRVMDAISQQQHKPEDDQPFFERCQARNFDLAQCRFFRYGMHDPLDEEKE